MALPMWVPSCLIVAGIGSLQLQVAASHGPSLLEVHQLHVKQPNASDPGNSSRQAPGQGKEKKMAAVTKVISLLESLQTKVTQEGEEETKLYNKFKAFCEDTSSQKNDAITKGEDKELELSTTLGTLKSRISDLEGIISAASTVIEDTEKEIKSAQATRSREREVYLTNEADLTKALEALTGAIQSLHASKPVTLAQLQAVSKTVSTAAVMAEALGLGGQQASKVAALFLQQAPTVPTKDYTFHSDDILNTLGSLQDSFRQKKTTVDRAEVAAVAAHDSLIQAKRSIITAKMTEIETSKQEKAQKEEQHAVTKQDLSVVSAELASNKEYLAELTQLCSDKAATYDQRKIMREDELAALSSAITILKDKVSARVSGSTLRFAQQAVRLKVAEAFARNEPAMEAAEAAAESMEAKDDNGYATPSFLQKGSRNLRSFGHATPDSREVVITLLKNKGVELKSASLAALAGTLAADPLAKVKTLIQELIERLLKQASAEETQKGWCDKSISAAKQKRNNAAQQITELNGNLARLEATHASLTAELALLQTSMDDLTQKQAEAVTMRQEEASDNNATVAEAEAGIVAVNEAITVLTQFYQRASQASLFFALKGPADDAPDSGFEINQTYTGAQGEAGGILGMLDVIKSDFSRTVSETQQAELQAQQDHLVFMTETGRSLAEMQTAQTEKTRQKVSAEDKLSTDSDNLESQVSLVESAITELLQLKQACETGMTYNERVERRQEEIAALKQAVCILENYQSYGAGAAGTC